MGNCQAAEAAAVVIQHPGGKVERLYGPAAAADVMRSNPGHYVALVVLRASGPAAALARQQDPAVAAVAGGATKVKLLKPKDALLLGQVYRLITSQEVAKAIQARRREESAGDRQEQGQERKRPEKVHHLGSAGGAAAGSGRGGRHWQPSLNSISEFAS